MPCELVKPVEFEPVDPAAAEVEALGDEEVPVVVEFVSST